MSVSSTSRIAGPFTQDGTTTNYPFTFKAFSAADLLVVRSTAGVESTLALTTDYTVTLNANQDANPGGSVVLNTAGAAGPLLTLTTAVPVTQTTSLSNAGGFAPSSLNGVFDKLTIVCQQLALGLRGALKFPLSDGVTGNATLPGKAARKGTVLAFDETSGNPVAGPTMAAVGTVSGNAASINTVAGSIANVNSVAAIVTDVTTVAKHATNINAVAGNAANITDVAGNATNVNTVAAGMADVHRYAATYLGSSATAPTTRLDGSALQTGDEYFSTATNLRYTWGGAAWYSGGAGAATAASLVSASDGNSGGLFSTVQGFISGMQSTAGSAIAGFDWAAIPVGGNKIDWGIQTAGNAVNVLRWIPPAEWAAIKNGTSTYNCSPAIQSALNYALGISSSIGKAGRVFAPSGKYPISNTIQVWSHIHFFGEGYSQFSAGSGGTEFVWVGDSSGGSGAAAIITSADKDSDWSNASIKSIRVTNSTGTSAGVIGLRCRNPQNGSSIDDVYVGGFPGGQFLMYEPSNRVSGGSSVVGATPAAFTTKNLYAVGGVVPIEVQCGGEPSIHTLWHAAPDSTSTTGIKITRSPFADAQRSSVCFVGSYVELQPTAGDIPGWVWDSDLPITFINCHTHHNGTSTSEAAWKYTFASRSIPTATFINCTSWKMAGLYRLATAGISKAPAVLSTPESFSMDWNKLGSDTSTTFGNPSVSASLSSAVFHILGNSAFGNAGFVVPFRCMLVGFTARTSTALTAGTANLVINKNGSAYVRDKTINVGESGFAVDYTVGTLITSAHVFEAGDRVTMQITTSAGMLPTGYGLVASVFLKRLP